jgi:hypothetical protein
MQNIPEVWQKIKNAAGGAISEWGSIAIVILLGLASFGLGRLSALEEAKPVVSVGQAPSTSLRGIAAGGLIVASRSGSAYHYPWCAGASAIKEGNKVWFKDEVAARAAGYKPAKNCKGLGSQ